MKIIQHYLDIRPDVEWITKQSGLPYLPLEMDVPVDDIRQEWETVKHLAVLHRPEESISKKFFYGHSGWKSLSIYGEHYSVTTRSSAKLSWTSIIDKCPKTKDWLEQNFIINENTGRIRFMLLEPQGHILPHVDREIKKLTEVNIAITNPAQCIFRFTHYGNIPFVPGSAFLMDTSNQHLVYNNSDQPRLHIIAHTKLRNQEMILKSYENRYYN